MSKLSQKQEAIPQCDSEKEIQAVTIDHEDDTQLDDSASQFVSPTSIGSSSRIKMARRDALVAEAAALQEQ